MSGWRVAKDLRRKGKFDSKSHEKYYSEKMQLAVRIFADVVGLTRAISTSNSLLRSTGPFRKGASNR